MLPEPRFLSAPGRRQLLRSAAVLPGIAVAAAAIAQADTPAYASDAVPVPRRGGKGTELVLLGTCGGPVPMHGRSGIASALVVDGHVYLVDAGDGALAQFAKAGLTMDQLTAAYITHLHSDHLADLFNLVWLRFGGYQPMSRLLDVYGPGPAGVLPPPYPSGRSVTPIAEKNPTPGLTAWIDGQIAASAYDINVRMLNEGWPDIRELVQPHDIELPDVGASPTGEMAPRMRPFEVMRDERVRVTAILADHPPVFPSYAYRFDTAQGSVVFSGDTTITPNMVRLARGADVLVHEAIDMQAMAKAGLSEEQMRHMEISHSDVTRLGELAQEAGVGTLVLSHLVPGGTDTVPDALWRYKAGRGFRGKVVVGRDLMRIPVRGPVGPGRG